MIITLIQVDKNINNKFIFYYKVKNFLQLELLIKVNDYFHYEVNKISIL